MNEIVWQRLASARSAEPRGSRDGEVADNCVPIRRLPLSVEGERGAVALNESGAAGNAPRPGTHIFGRSH